MSFLLGRPLSYITPEGAWMIRARRQSPSSAGAFAGPYNGVCRLRLQGKLSRDCLRFDVAGAAALKQYKYKGEDRSLLYKYVLSPLADGVARQLPEWLA